MRKSIARVLTVISQTQRSALREAYKGKVCFTHSRDLHMTVTECNLLSWPIARVRAVCLSTFGLFCAEVPALGPADKEDSRHPAKADALPGMRLPLLVL